MPWRPSYETQFCGREGCEGNRIASLIRWLTHSSIGSVFAFDSAIHQLPWKAWLGQEIEIVAFSMSLVNAQKDGESLASNRVWDNGEDSRLRSLRFHWRRSLGGWAKLLFSRPEFATELLARRVMFFLTRGLSSALMSPDGFLIDTPDILVAYWSMVVEGEVKDSLWVEPLISCKEPPVVAVWSPMPELFRTLGIA